MRAVSRTRWLVPCLLFVAVAAISQTTGPSNAKSPGASTLAPKSSAALQIALTFDDLPAHGSLPPGTTRTEVITKIAAALKLARAPSVFGFVNGNWLDQHPADISALQAWRDAGFRLGNHSWSHMNLNQHPLEEFQTDVIKNEAVLAKWKDNDFHWFRFPFLAEGDTREKRAGVRAFLLQRGYKIAGVTMSFADYLWTEPYARCRTKRDSQAIAQLEGSFLKAAEDNIEHYRAMSHTLFGRDIPYVLLMHVGALDAEMLPRVLDIYRSHGFEFIPLEKAEQDPFYAQDSDLRLAPAPDMLEGAMAERHLAIPAAPLPGVQFENICK